MQEIKQIMTHKRRSSVPTEFAVHLLAWAWLLELVRYAAGLSTYESLHICVLTLLSYHRSRSMLCTRVDTEKNCCLVAQLCHVSCMF